MGFLPLGDDNSQRRTIPFVVWIIVGINIAVYLLQLALGDDFNNGYAVVPQKITTGIDFSDPQTITLPGIDHPVVIPEALGPHPIYLTFLTSMFMHGGIMHIAGNMLYMVIFADQIEDLLGHLRFAFFYLLCGLAAGLAQVFYDPHSVIPCLGASGAIAGCLGAYLVKYPTNPVRVIVLRSVMPLPAWVVLGAWIGLQLYSQFRTPQGGSGVAYMAHIGGFSCGVILVYLLAIGRTPPDTPPVGNERSWN
jgi:membrane associated rhomboid family serine protease